MKTKIRSLVALLMVLLFVAGTLTPASAASSKSVKLNKTTVVLEQSAIIKLSVSGTKDKVKWATSDKKVAKVSKGKVTAVAEGSAVITATVGKEKYTCKVTVVDNNRTDRAETVDSNVTSYTVATSGGGDFICKESKLAIKFKLDTTTGGAQLLIYDALDECVFAETFSTIKAGKETAFTWMGKDDSGKYASEGTYFVKVKCKDTVNDLGSFTIYEGNEFAGGNGSESNPYKVSSVEEFKKIVKHADACFIQTKDLDFEYENLDSMFTTVPFGGTYDGNNKKISNVVLKDAIFKETGESGVLKNIVIENALLNLITEIKKENDSSILVNTNFGKIDSCKVNGEINGGNIETDFKLVTGFIAFNNKGTINKCEATGKLALSSRNLYDCYVGGIAAINSNGAKIVNCKNNAEINYIFKTDWSPTKTLYIGGIVGSNEGTIVSCESNKAPIATNPKGGAYGIVIGDIAGNNTGTIQSSYFKAN